MNIKTYLLIGIVVFIIAVVALTYSLNLVDKDGPLSAASSDNGCGGGFVELPPELEAEFAKQSSLRSTNIDTDSKLLKHDVTFWGFRLREPNNAPRDEDKLTFSTCSEIALTRPREVKFIPDDMNWLLRLYISSVVSNELILSEAATKKLAEVKLCTQINCGEAPSFSDETSFTISNSADLTYARVYSDSMLQLDLMNKLNEISKLNGSSFTLDEQSMVQILTSARRTAILRSIERK